MMTQRTLLVLRDWREVRLVFGVITVGLLRFGSMLGQGPDARQASTNNSCVKNDATATNFFWITPNASPPREDGMIVAAFLFCYQSVE
jgi:hypothetical protein